MPWKVLTDGCHGPSDGTGPSMVAEAGMTPALPAIATGALVQTFRFLSGYGASDPPPCLRPRSTRSSAPAPRGRLRLIHHIILQRDCQPLALFLNPLPGLRL